MIALSLCDRKGRAGGGRKLMVCFCNHRSTSASNLTTKQGEGRGAVGEGWVVASCRFVIGMKAAVQGKNEHFCSAQ